MNTIQTAEDFINSPFARGLSTHGLMVEFARLHVKEALSKAYQNAKIKYDYSGNTGSEYCDECVDKDSIINSYPLDNIK